MLRKPRGPLFQTFLAESTMFMKAINVSVSSTLNYDAVHVCFLPYDFLDGAHLIVVGNMTTGN